MKQKSGPDKAPAEQVLKNIRRQTRRQYSAEEKIRIVLEGLRGEESISELCRREGIAASMYYGWSRSFLRPASAVLYTGVTPGKKLVVLVGQKKAVAIAVRNIDVRGRHW